LANPADDTVKLAEHRFRFFGHMVPHIDPRGKRTVAFPGKHHDLNLEFIGLVEGGIQLINHFDRNDIERRTIEDDAGHAWSRIKLNRRIGARHLPSGLRAVAGLRRESWKWNGRSQRISLWSRATGAR